MTTNTATTDVGMTAEPELSEDEFGAMQRADVPLDPGHEQAAPDQYPRLWNVAAGMMYKAVIRAEVPASAEYVTVPMQTGRLDDLNVALTCGGVAVEHAVGSCTVPQAVLRRA